MTCVKRFMSSVGTTVLGRQRQPGQIRGINRQTLLHIIGFGLSVAFIHRNKNIEYHRPYLLIWIEFK